ncbi:MAG: (Fe-S)-binding protein [Candidatus Baldrarchaeia archaeon]
MLSADVKAILEKYRENATACIHVRCGFCREECPMYRYFKFDSYAAKGKMGILYWLLNDKIEFLESVVERIYACTTCGFCDVVCGFNQSEAIEAMRQVAVMLGKAPMDKHKAIIEKTLLNGNPYGEPREKRLDWLPKDIKLSENAETLFYVGCTSAYRTQKIAQNAVKILTKANVDFTILKDETCCGSVHKRIGDIEVAKKLAEHNVETFEENGFKTIITSCPGCYRTFKEDYPKLLGRTPKFEVKHIVEVIKELIEKGELKPVKDIKFKVTYHDPCHLGRHMGIYDEPRFIIENIPGIQLVEMEWNKKFSRCCGSGGAFRSAFPEASIAIAAERLREAIDVGADTLVTACPFCILNFDTAVKQTQLPINVMNIEELVVLSSD